MNEPPLSDAPQSPDGNAPGLPPLAVVEGEAIHELPQDLYIPPDALRVFLETFEGPLDLLLHLIRAQNLDILSLPIAKITDQYMGYIEMMKELRLELAAEYMLMAAILAEIKSRMLLPHPVEDEVGEDDPRAELVRRLLEYERFKQAAENIDGLPRSGRESYGFEMDCDELEIVKPLPDVQCKDLVVALQEMFKRAAARHDHHITREPLPVQERITGILQLLHGGRMIMFEKCFTPQEGVAGVIVSFLALLDLLKAGMVVMAQSKPYAPIYLRAA